MSYFQNLAEQKIREAIERGDFDKLELAGQPLDHSDYMNAPPELRAVYNILKNAGVVPEEVDLLNSIHRIRTQMKCGLTRDEKERLTRERVLMETRLNVIKEQRLVRGNQGF